MEKPLADRIAVVTGASRGIGYHTALELAKRGAHVVAVARTEGGLTELDDAIKAEGGAATLVPLDLKNFDGIDRLGAALYERFGRVDIFVGNAGVLGGLSPIGHIKPKTWDEVIAVNVTANYRLLRSFDALFRQSDGARIVLLSSGAARNFRQFWGAYSVSKAATEALASTYAAELDKTPHRVNLYNPGGTATHMRAQAMPGEDQATLPSPQDVAIGMMPLVMPDVERNGALYSFRSASYVDEAGS